MKKTILVILILLTASEINAQQDPQYTQYMYNMNVINPAYAGYSDATSVGILYRNQWEGLEGAPKTATMNIHFPAGKNVGLGFSAISDEIGPVSETNLYIDFSYTLNLNNDNRLAFGIKAGGTFHDIGLVDLALIDPNDPFFANKSILLIEKEHKNSNDRTWCFWEKGKGELDHIVSKSWKSAIFKAKNFKTNFSIMEIFVKF